MKKTNDELKGVIVPVVPPVDHEERVKADPGTL